MSPASKSSNSCGGVRSIEVDLTGGHSFPECGGDLLEGRGHRVFRGWNERDRGAGVAAFAGLRVDGDLGEKGHVQRGGFAHAAAFAEEVVAMAVVALEPRHVFDEAED